LNSQSNVGVAEMTEISKEKLSNQTPKWLQIIVSAILGGGGVWYAWFRYNTLVNRPDSSWYGWVQVAFLVLIGVLCIWATVLFIWGKPSGSSLLKLGISIIPLFLFSNLVILIFRVIQNIVHGDAALFLDRVFAQPHKFILIPIVVILLLWLESLTKRDSRNR
jgi:hypothetical protein